MVSNLSELAQALLTLAGAFCNGQSPGTSTEATHAGQCSSTVTSPAAVQANQPAITASHGVPPQSLITGNPDLPDQTVALQL